MSITFTAMPTPVARAIQSGQADVYGNPPERQIADDGGYQCRHCLTIIPPGAPMLLMAYRPFEQLDAYAETGPVFVCADECEGFGTQTTVPQTLNASADYMMKAYGKDDRIIYGTGKVVPAQDMTARAKELFGDPNVAYIHVRSSRNNCYQARIDRA